MDGGTQKDIDRIVWRILRDSGITSPPVLLDPLMDHLSLHRTFYDLSNPGFIDRGKYNLEVAGHRIIDLVKRLSLRAVLFFDENRIVVDSKLPPLRKEWPSYHEVAHKTIPWHKAYFRHDTAQTLNPDWQEALEEEANFGASALMFCGPVFTEETLDTVPSWAAVQGLGTRYGRTLTTTLRRYVQHGPEIPMAVIVSSPPWEPVPSDQTSRCRHFVRSKAFVELFGEVTWEQALRIVEPRLARRSGGPVGDFSDCLVDCNGESQEFRFQAFNNRYWILTLCVRLTKLTSKRIIVPPSGVADYSQSGSN